MYTNIGIKELKITGKQKTNDLDYEDRRISYFIITLYFIQILNLVTKTIFPIPESLYSKISVLFGLVLLVVFLLTIYPVLKRNIIAFIFTEFLFIGIFAISFLMGNAELPLLLYNAIWSILICVPLGIYMYSIKNKQIFYNMFLKSSFLMTISLFLIFFFPAEDSYYNMSFSYALLIPTLFHMNEWHKNRKIIYLLLSFLEIAQIMIYGSRGPLMSIIFFLMLQFIFREKNLIKKVSIIMIFLFIFIIFYFNFELIGTTVIDYLASKGYYSRTLTLFFLKEITNDAGRRPIFKYYFDLAFQKPLLGWGVLGGWVGKGSGPHNMIIEILLAFGVIFGGIISFILVLLQFRVLFIKDESTRDLLMIYMSICIVLFFVSGNFLQNYDFFIFLGLVFGSFKNNEIEESI